MRFDDRLATVLAADTAPPSGAAASWRQLVDLLGRGRVADEAPALARLAALRDRVPAATRAASARALALAKPSPGLVALFAADDPAVAAPVLRAAMLEAPAWEALLPRLTPPGRAVLRHRRDLPAAVVRALEAFGSTDFQLAGSPAPAAEAPPVTAPPLAANDPAPPPAAPPAAPFGPTPFVALGEVARGLPVVAEALRRSAAPDPAAVSAPRFEIADLVARLDAFHRDRPTAAPALAVDATPPDSFRWQADADGTVRWVEGIARATLVSFSLIRPAAQGLVRVDAVPGGAWRRRDAFRDARLEIGGVSLAAGAWRVAGSPLFDPATGRFTGFAGTARRARREDSAAAPSPDALRQLVHELRTPTNAIAGFAELIGTELFGPVPPVYRDRAGTIAGEAAALTTAIDDLDTAARIDGGALELRPAPLALAPLLAVVARDLAPLAARRGARLSIADTTVTVRADDRALERLMSRLLATLLAAASPGETIEVGATLVAGAVTLAITRPRALAPAGEHDGDDMPLLGTAFALRLARNLARELGGALEVGAERLTLRVPAALAGEVEQAAAR